nr:putative ribonuclease H-like domain-containing protein [Tanacetum cinerariifolium]
MLDYGFNFMNTTIFIDNQSTICIVKNPVFYQRTKHIEIRHHFIQDANEKNLIQVLKIHTDDNVADLLTKAFDGPRFEFLVVHIGMVVITVASCTFFLLTGWFLLVVLYFCWWFSFLLDPLFLLVAMDYAGGYVFMLAGYIYAASVVYAVKASVQTADLICAVSTGSHSVSTGSLQSCWYNHVSADEHACTAQQMVFSSPWLTAKKEYGLPLQTASVCKSNPLMVVRLPKTGCSPYYFVYEELASPEQTASGKNKSNPLYSCDSLPKTVRVF